MQLQPIFIVTTNLSMLKLNFIRIGFQFMEESFPRFFYYSLSWFVLSTHETYGKAFFTLVADVLNQTLNLFAYQLGLVNSFGHSLNQEIHLIGVTCGYVTHFLPWEINWSF
jgi:hypothetical protein